MCLIAYRPKPGAHIPNEVIEFNLRSNPDGFGLAWRDGDIIRHVKYAPDEKAEFVRMLKEIDATDMTYTAHWRKATHGPKSRDLAHPFEYTDKDGKTIILFHNGIIDIETNHDESDTSAFVDYVLKGLPYGWWKDASIKFLVEASIGWSRILLMTPDGEVILNASKWRADNGIAYSTDPKPVPVVVAPKTSWLPAKYQPSEYKPTWESPYYGGSGSKSFRPEEVEEEEDDETTLTQTVKWYDKGHPVTPVTSIDSGSDLDADHYGVVKCDECCTDGEYFVIDGTLNIELDHFDFGRKD
jgi:hypothetical protein